jgi:hypothetical protein
VDLAESPTSFAANCNLPAPLIVQLCQGPNPGDRNQLVADNEEWCLKSCSEGILVGQFAHPDHAAVVFIRIGQCIKKHLGQRAVLPFSVLAGELFALGVMTVTLLADIVWPN